MKYKCNHCKKEFDLPATITYRPIVNLPPSMGTAAPVPSTTLPWPSGFSKPTIQVAFNYEIQQSCCPYCYSTDVEEDEG